MSNVENLMILSGITIISGVSLWILNKKETPKNSPKKKTPKKRSATPIRSPTPEPKSITIKEEIKTPLPTIRNTPKILKAKTVRSPAIVPPKEKTVRSPKATKEKTVRSPATVAPKEKTIRSPATVPPKEKTVAPITIRPAIVTPSPIRETPEPRVKFGRPKSILRRRPTNRTRRRSDESISSTDATLHTEVTDRNEI